MKFDQDLCKSHSTLGSVVPLAMFMNKMFLFVLEDLLLLFVCDSHISRSVIASETKSQLLFQMKILYSVISSQQGFS